MLKRLTLIITLFFCAIGLRAQDLITRTDGSHIYCRIIRIDSTAIIYKTPQVRDEQMISRTLVQSYYQSSSASRTTAEPNNKPKDGADLILLKFYIGSSRPLAEFARQDINDELAGLALGGFAAGVEGIVKVHKLIGISMAYKFQANPFNVDVIVDDLRANIQQVTFSGEAEPWKMRGLFAGLHLCFPLPQPEGLWITGAVGAGIPRFVFPDINLRGESNGFAVTVHQYAAPVSSPAVTGGLGLRYKASPVFAFDLNVDFYRGEPTFRVITSDNLGTYETSSYKQRIRTVNISAGITFCFQSHKQ